MAINSGARPEPTCRICGALGMVGIEVVDGNLWAMCGRHGLLFAQTGWQGQPVTVIEWSEFLRRYAAWRPDLQREFHLG